MNITTAAVLGAGSWGTALGRCLALKGIQVNLFARDKALALDINTSKENRKYLPDVPLPALLKSTSDLDEAINKAQMVVLAIPSHGLRDAAAELKKRNSQDIIVVSTSKGLDVSSLQRPSEILEEVMGEEFSQRLVVLSGPSHAEEVARDIPTTVSVSGKSLEAAEWVQDAFISGTFRVYTNPDLIGVELGGALKNIIALACGVSEGLGFGDNTKAALITRGLAEITRLGVVLGANPMTFAGLTGLGDLVVTCTSRHSRNNRAGILIGQGKSLEEALSIIGQVVEGVKTAKAAKSLADKHQVEMPISREAYHVLFSGKSPREAVESLMGRVKTHEVEEGFLN